MARLIFDLDGTLAHTVPALCRAGNRLLEDLGRAPVSEAMYAGYVGRGMRVQVEELLRGSGGVPEDGRKDGRKDGPIDGLEAALDRFLAHYRSDAIAGVAPFPDVPEVLAALARSHRLGVCTQKPEAPARHLLAALGLARHFRAITGGDTLDCLKPDPRMLAHTAEALGGEGPILMIGDSETDRETARRAEVPFLLFEGGYRKASVAALAPEASFADWAELPRHLSILLGEPA